MPSPEEVKKLIEDAGGTVTDMGALPDNSGFAIASFPLPKTHWIYQGDRTESYGTFNVPPMTLRMGQNDMAIIEIGHRRTAVYRREFAELIRVAGKYAVRCATMNGADMDFDPDALLQNLVVGFLGYWTETGLSGESWDNPPTSTADRGQGPERAWPWRSET